MFITKIVSDLIDVIFFVNLHQDLEKVRILEISKGDFIVIIGVKSEEDPHNDGVLVSILKLRSCLEELQTWVCVK